MHLVHQPFLTMTTWTGKRILFLTGMFEVLEKLLYIKSEMDTTKLFKGNL